MQEWQKFILYNLKEVWERGGERATQRERERQRENVRGCEKVKERKRDRKALLVKAIVNYNILESKVIQC